MNWDLNFNLLLRIFLSCLSGYAIGAERASKNKSAGSRTHTIVCLGSCLAMIISKYGFYDVKDYDAARVAAQIVSGIGFLGAGIIFVKNNDVTGLTTAAGIWTTSIVGMSFGAGMYFLAIITTSLIIILQNFLHVADIFQKHDQFNILIQSYDSNVVGDIDEYIEKNNIAKMAYNLKYKEQIYYLSFRIYPKNNQEMTDFLNHIEANPSIEEFKVF